MIRGLILYGVLCLLPLAVLAQASKSDCAGAIVLCDDIYFESQASFTYGNTYEFTGQCNANLEVSSVWYTFTVQEPGAVRFVLTANTSSADYDWAMFDVTNGGCGGLGTSSPIVSCNSWGSSSNGPTGISTPMGGTSNTAGPGTGNGPPFNADVMVQPGQTYALVVMNWSNSSSGYTIDFGSSTAVMYDEIPPEMVSASVNCAETTVTIQLSEPVLVSSVQAADFAINMGGEIVPVLNAQPQNISGGKSDLIVLTIAGPVAEPGAYTLSLTNSSGSIEDGCGNLGSGSLTINLYGDLVDMSDPQTICLFQSAEISANPDPAPGVTYTWSPSGYLDDPGSATTMATPWQTTTYTVNAQTPSGCSSQGSVTITVVGGNIIELNASPEEVAFCAGENAQIEVSTEGRIWFDDFDPGISWGDWQAIEGGAASTVCGSVSTNALYFNGSPLREATTVPLDLSGGGTVYFSLKVADGAAPCENADPGDNVVLSYSVNNGPFVDIQTFLESDYPDFTEVAVPVPLAAQSGNVRFRWRQVGAFINNQDNWALDNVYIGSDNTDDFTFAWTPADGIDDSFSTTPVISPSQNTVYYVEVIDPNNNCFYRDSVVVTVGQPFTLDMREDTTLCDALGTALYAIPDVQDDFTYTWTPSATLDDPSSPSPYATPLVSTVYEVHVVSAGLCEADGEIRITVGIIPPMYLIASDDSICEGDEIIVEADLEGGVWQGLSFEWSPDDGLENPNLSFTQATPLADVLYHFVITHDESGCQSSDSVQIAVSPTFYLSVSPADTAACITDGMELTATATTQEPLEWSWYPDSYLDDASLQTVTINTDVTATYLVTATNPTGCTAEASAHVERVVEVTDLGPDISVCEDELPVLDTGWPDNYTIVWNTGDETSSIVASESGTYAVEVTSPGGCFSSDEIDVTLYPYPVVDLGADTTLCQLESVKLNAGTPGFNYKWNTGSAYPEITVTQSGNYSVTVDNGYCFASDSKHVTFVPLPSNPFPDHIRFCFSMPPATLELDAQNPGSTYEWSTEELSQSIVLSEPEDVSVLVTTGIGCESVFYIQVEEICPGVIYAPNSFTPDGDGINDVWFVRGDFITDFHLRIFDRWGELFFETEDMNEPWIGQRRDGNYYVPDGVYFYLITYKSYGENGRVSDVQQHSGHITLIR